MTKDKLIEGTKFDGDKLRYDLVPPELDAAVAAVLTFGAAKYEDRNWEKGIKYSRVYAAMRRHLDAWLMGESLDEETGMPHLWHVATNIAMLIAFTDRGNYSEFDDLAIDTNTPDDYREALRRVSDPEVDVMTGLQDTLFTPGPIAHEGAATTGDP